MERDAQTDSGNMPPDWDEPPPFLRTWRRVYTAVVLYTLVLVVILYILTITMNR